MRFHPDNRLILPVMMINFFGSGFSALLYQVVWQRMLGLFSGSDVRSATVVIGAYLAGLGVGSLVGSIFVDRLSSRQAVGWFGVCNLGIAVFAFLSRFLFYDLLFKELSALPRFPLVEFLLIFASLLWPTTLMGLSLPLLSRALVLRPAAPAGRISLLNGINNLGAGMGSLMSGWYIIGTIGYEYTIYLGGLLNVGVGLAALGLRQQFLAGDCEDERTMPVSPSGLVPWPSGVESVALRDRTSTQLALSRVPGRIWVWCGLVFVSGFIAISLELIWFRVLDVILESNAYTFAHLLAFILLGYALGSMYGARIVERVRHPRQLFLGLQGLIALYAVGAIWGSAWLIRQEGLAELFKEARGQIIPGMDSPVWLLGYILLPLLILLPPNLLIGFCFPLVQKAVQTNAHVVGQRVGLVLVANIIGNVAGGVLTGLVIFQFWGSPGALRLVSLLGVLMVLAMLGENLRVLTWPKLAGAGVLVALLASLFFFPEATPFWAGLHRLNAEQFIVAEDASGVAALSKWHNNAILYANGQPQGMIPFAGVHVVLGALPALIHPNPKQVLVIGIGSGGTPYAVGINPQTERIVVIEILGSELMVLHAYAAEAEGWPLKALFTDQRYEIIIGDGRRELALLETKFDIIEVDAMVPWKSHSGLLYSKELFEEMRAKLAEGGLVAQWRPTDRIEATFLSVFPHVLKFRDDILIGSNSPIPLNDQVIFDRLEKNPHFTQYLHQGGIQLDRHIVWLSKVWTPLTPRQSDDINTDLFPKDEYYLNN